MTPPLTFSRIPAADRAAVEALAATYGRQLGIRGKATARTAWFLAMVRAASVVQPRAKHLPLKMTPPLDGWAAERPVGAASPTNEGLRALVMHLSGKPDHDRRYAAAVAALRIFEREVGVAVLTRDLTAGACLTHGAAVQAIKDLRDANLLDVAIDGPGHVRRPIGTVAPLAGAVLAILRSRGNSSLERILGALAPRAVTAREVTEALDALREGGLAERSGSFWMATKVAQVPALPVEERVALALRGVLVHLPPSRAGKREAAALALLTKLEADGRFDTTDGMGGDALRELVGVRGRAMGVALDDLLAARLVERHGFTVKPGGTTHFRVRRPSVQR